MIYFDLDGVLRDISYGVFGEDAVEWNQKTKCGKSLPEYIDDNLDILLTAPIMKYEKVFHALHDRWDVRIMTAQRKKWIPYTMQWLHENMPYVDIVPEVLFVGNPEIKLKYLGTTDILIDDHPCYGNNPQVIIVDHTYNRHVEAAHRVKNVRQLQHTIRKLHN